MFVTGGLSKKNFLEIIRLCCNSLEWGVLSNLRFFKHYDTDLIWYIRKKIIPNSDFKDINAILNFYQKNKKDMGERFMHSELFEDL